MARFKFLVPVKVSGLFQNMVFKNRNGKDFISPRPRQNHKLEDKNSLFNQNQFKFISEFTTEVNKVKFIKDIWMKKYPDCWGSYQEIYKANFHGFLYTDSSGIPKVTPDDGFKLKNLKVEMHDDNLCLTAEPLDLLQQFMSKYFTYAAFIIFRSPDLNKPEEFKLLTINGENRILTYGSPIQIGINLECYINQFEPNHYITQIYLVYAILNKNEKPLRYSELISHFITN